MENLRNSIKNVFKKYAPQYWWGDHLDVRFFLSSEISKLRNKKILDIGCNIGLILNSADESNDKFGFDSDTKAISIAKMINKDFHKKAHFYVRDVFKSTPKKESFDVVILANVLPGFDYPGTLEQCRKLIAIATRCLKEGGTLYLTTPNGANSFYKNKIKIYETALSALLTKDYDFVIKCWNPFPIQLDHLLQFIPWRFNLLYLFMKHDVGRKRGTAFFVKAIKRNNGKLRRYA
jgi:SAM-dependent methyltransferase